MTRDQEILMFGCSLEQVRHMFEHGMELSGPSMTVMSILSDVQELINTVAGADLGDADQERLELARQYINRAKLGIAEYLRNS